MDPVLKFHNDPIQFVKEAEFLGLIWDTKLNFEPHIKYPKALCQKSLNILKVLSRTEWVQIELHYWNYIASWLEQL